MRHYPIIVAGMPPQIRRHTFCYSTGIACWIGRPIKDDPHGAWNWHEVHPIEYDGTIQALLPAFPSEIQFKGLCDQNDFLIPGRYGGKVTEIPVRLDIYRDQWDKNFFDAVMGSGIPFVSPLPRSLNEA